MTRTTVLKPEHVPAASQATLDSFSKGLGFTPNMMASLYTLKPLPRDAERARTRAWTRIKSGT